MQSKNKLDYYRGKNCMKNVCLALKEHATKIINYEKKELIPLTKEEKIAHLIVFKEDAIYAKKTFSNDDKNRKYHKVKDHCHYTGKYGGPAHDVCNLRYKIPKEIPVVFHNGST